MSKSETQSLLPCPFCSSGAIDAGDSRASKIMCGNPDCEASTGSWWARIDCNGRDNTGKQKAIAAWNRRAKPPAPTGQPEQSDREAVEEWLAECTDGRVSEDTKRILRAFSHWYHRRLGIEQGKRMAGVEVIKDVTVHLIAAVSLLEKLHADLAPSKKHALFSTKLADYRASAERGRAALTEQRETEHE